MCRRIKCKLDRVCLIRKTANIACRGPHLIGGRGCRKKWQRRKQSRRFSEPDVLDCGATNPADRVVLGLLVDNMATVVVAFELVNEQAVVMAHHIGEGDKSTVL